MTLLKEYLKRREYLLIFIGIILLFGILTGVFLVFSNTDYLLEHVLISAHTLSPVSYLSLFHHFLCLFLGIIFSIIGIGFPFFILVIFFEGISIGFILSLFSIQYFLKGTLFAFLYILISKSIYILILILLAVKSFFIMRDIIFRLVYHKSVKTRFKSTLKACLCLLIFSFIYDLFLLLFGRLLIQVFNFLIL